VPEFHAEAPQETASEGLAQGPYVAAKAGFKPATLQTSNLPMSYQAPQFDVHVCTSNILEHAQ